MRLSDCLVHLQDGDEKNRQETQTLHTGALSPATAVNRRKPKMAEDGGGPHSASSPLLFIELSPGAPSGSRTHPSDPALPPQTSPVLMRSPAREVNPQRQKERLEKKQVSLHNQVNFRENFYTMIWFLIKLLRLHILFLKKKNPDTCKKLFKNQVVLSGGW